MTSPRIGLALSGGGFRATLFHLGAIRCLREAGLLSNVHRITSVSGGSILAAHLVVNWEKYNGDDAAFDDAATELIRFTMSDMRGRVIRGWLMAWITILPRLFALKSRRWTMTNLLQRHYDKLLHGRTLGDLPPTPDLQIMCTSMTKGTSCSFDRRGIAFHQDPLHEISTTSLKLGFAVAASSAFPPLFPPVRVDHEVLMCGFNELPISEVLTDGGIFDNLGIERLIAAHEERQDTDLLVISDAEGSFDWAPDESYANLLTRNIRASDMLMRRVSLFQSGYLWAQRKDVLRIHIGNIISKDDDSSVPDPGTQRALRNVRTDLDKFSNREVAALIAHGYAVTRKMLVSSNVCKSAPTFSWAKITQMLGATPKQWERKDELESSSRRWRLLSITDLSTWITLGSISACFVAVLFFLVLLPSMQIRDLRKDNEILANSPSAYIRNNHEKSVIIFVHGINGDAVETWTCASGHTYWPKMLTEDQSFSHFDIYTIGYPSRLTGGGLSLHETAQAIRLRLEYSNVLRDHQNVVFVTHDLGGLLVQSMLLSDSTYLSNISAIVNFGVPFNGANLAKLAGTVFSNPQVKAMTYSPEIESIELDWRSLNSKIKMYCAYETLPTFGVNVVDQISATTMCNQPSVAIDANHVNLVKPCDRSALSYQFLENSIKNAVPSPID